MFVIIYSIYTLFAVVLLSNIYTGSFTCDNSYFCRALCAIHRQNVLVSRQTLAKKKCDIRGSFVLMFTTHVIVRKIRRSRDDESVLCDVYFDVFIASFNKFFFVKIL